MLNVYDFDHTIAYFDSGFAFFGFCFRRHPLRLLRWLPRQVVELLRFAAKRKRGSPKGNFYLFERSLPDWQAEVAAFWARYADEKLKGWYLAQKQGDDIIISCTAEFLLRPICDDLGVRLIATTLDDSFSLVGCSCYGEEKVRRLRDEYGDVQVAEFYSDSHADTPLASIAQQAFFVQGDDITPWKFG
jgi:phosphoserine phosphatase